MHLMNHAARIALAGAATLSFTACADDVLTTAPSLQSVVRCFGRLGRNGFQFTRLSSS